MASGNTTRTQQVANFCAAVVGVGMLGSTLTKSPMKSRWLSSSSTLAIVLFGFFTHNLLPRVWCKAFPDWHIPRNVDDSDDYHSYVRSKAYRAKLYLNGQHSRWKAAVISFATQSVDHLMMVPPEISMFFEYRLPLPLRTESRPFLLAK